jgi:hypothetical protein
MAHRPGGLARPSVRSILMTALLVALTTAPAYAQNKPPDENTLALLWSRGDFRAPLVCEIAGEAHRGFRRVLIEAGPPQVAPEVNRLRFYDLEVPPGSHCVTETRGASPNVLGVISFLRRGRSRPDTAQRDFSAALRKDGGFSFEVVSGQLRIGPSEDPEALRVVDFRRGAVHFEEIRRGTDAWRRMADLPASRKLTLRLEATDGTLLEFDLIALGQP